MTATKYLNHLDMRRNTPFRIKDGKGFYLYEGREISPAEFNKMFPLPMYVRPGPKNGHEKGPSPDTTQRWLDD
jgi:hypothetical protein